MSVIHLFYIIADPPGHSLPHSYHLLKELSSEWLKLRSDFIVAKQLLIRAKHDLIVASATSQSKIVRARF